jgi:hypothetical protein
MGKSRIPYGINTGWEKSRVCGNQCWIRIVAGSTCFFPHTQTFSQMRSIKIGETMTKHDKTVRGQNGTLSGHRWPNHLVTTFWEHSPPKCGFNLENCPIWENPRFSRRTREYPRYWAAAWIPGFGRSRYTIIYTCIMGDDLSTNYVGTGIPPRSTSAPPAGCQGASMVCQTRAFACRLVALRWRTRNFQPLRSGSHGCHGP